MKVKDVMYSRTWNRFYYPLLLSLKSIIMSRNNSFSMTKKTHLSTSVFSATVPKDVSPTATNTVVKSSQARTIPDKILKKACLQSPGGLLRFKLDLCSVSGDLVEALRLYDDARSKGIPLHQRHYNVLLYLCSSSVESRGGRNDDDSSNLGLRRGFEIFQQMGIDGIASNEATFTSVARLAVAKEDPEMAFDLVKKMRSFGISPKLRSYLPALFGFCKMGEADKAYEVDAHMVASGVTLEEPELAALLRLSADAGRGDKVYEMLHRLRATVRQVSESTAEIVESWFKSNAAAGVGKENWDVARVKEGVVRGGGGWHGEGWLGKGKWRVVRTDVNDRGICRCCGEKLVCIDIDLSETENFASSLSSLACRREVKGDFNNFRAWLLRHGPFHAVIDGANVGLTNQHSFSFSQLSSVVSCIRQMSPSKHLPLIVLHSSRIKGGPAQNPHTKKLLEKWENSGALYATPCGSNDDWYWLYAAVNYKCLLVTNDEMRDHLFQLLGTSFFPRWKEKHQVRFTMSRQGPTLHMPPLYSIVIQESERGSWHVPTVIRGNIKTPRQWLCATRAPYYPNTEFLC
ncbi:PREDICTED: proteinaceous RNase P 1, chloroplastic/mitochondrial-like [Nelumbo nucifera]|uniref:ribonuclease P n=1 Tax=Nelumbo nucifera TaxID=4432 RepID=A0A1U8APW4_NELNU|nr:PREDICTED: proteinaceous RNase P 1, chloroplastic/mitochondrial-like [Nelumbo nucifera]